MSVAAVAVVLLILAGGVVWGCVVDWLRSRDHDVPADEDLHHIPNWHADRLDHVHVVDRDNDVRWRP